MRRRAFLRTVAAGAVAATTGRAWAETHPAAKTPAARPAGFRLKYAPHFGMFVHHAGKDLVDQIKNIVILIRHGRFVVGNCQPRLSVKYVDNPFLAILLRFC